MDPRFIMAFNRRMATSSMHALILGSKEYPLGTSDGSDPSPSGGMEVYVQGLAEALSEKGIQVTLITRLFSGTKADGKKGNIRVLRVPFMRGFYLRNPSFNIASFFRALRLDFDMIISNGEVSNFMGLMLSRIKGKPIIMVSHGLAGSQPQYSSAVRALFRLCDRITYPNADAVVTHAPWQMREITGKFHTIMPGFDRTKFRRLPSAETKRFRAKYAQTDEKVILYTGRVIAVKGIEYLIKSLHMLRHKHVCLIVGDGPDMEKCKALAEKEGANVKFAGFRKDVASFLSIADVFVLPSFSESLNYSLVEAAYMGVPLVCTDIGVIGRDCALLARPGDEESLARSITQALAKKDSRKIESARKYASSFDWNKSADEYIKLMRSVVK